MSIMMDSKHLCIRQLDPSYDDLAIQALLFRLGCEHSPDSLKLSRDKEYSNHNLCILQFSNNEIATKVLHQLYACKYPDSDRPLKITWAVMPTKGKPLIKATEYPVYVGDIDLTVTDNMLLDFFRDKFSNVVSAKVIIDPNTKISKGYGFVKFTNQEESERAIQLMNGEKLLGKHVRTSQAHFKKSELQQLEQQTQPYFGPWGAPYHIQPQIFRVQHQFPIELQKSKPKQKQQRRNLKVEVLKFKCRKEKQMGMQGIERQVVQWRAGLFIKLMG